VAEVPRANLTDISRGVRGELTIPGNASGDSEKRKITVVGVSPLVDEVTGTSSVEFQLVEPSKNSLPIGLLARASFFLNQRKAFSVPETALVYREKEIFVRKVVNSHIVFVPTKVNRVTDGIAELAETAVKSGDSLVVRSNVFVDNGQSVAVESQGVVRKDD
jgi:multidrug efflux pump subunit AcrA (membrane-fusion protein)